MKPVQQRRRVPRQRSSYVPLVFLACLVGLVMQSRWLSKNKDRLASKHTVQMYTNLTRTEPYPVTCARCEGRGTFKEGMPCGICYGMGMHEVIMEREMETLCHDCLGMGRRFHGPAQEAEDCSPCSGRGVIRVNPTGLPGLENLKVECHFCMGSGAWKGPDDRGRKQLCPVCYGTRFHTARRFSEQEGLCPGCGGMGRVMQDDLSASQSCSRCSGRGLISGSVPAP